ncbi:tetratricopeptide repeat protein [Sulfitobacter sp. D35]|uniref:tetratricopeptide repeat protein n=1 Tax=Sulfitobacter sp. D35 TaxID=3083252 RepID=UPI00296FDED6|nr:tetratricopeptide repeat protein [Sulfitobacter sp. D35]MDW4496465.1 tetratricopeptide repeat protein [Sulfitobacter sp. D35]
MARLAAVVMLLAAPLLADQSGSDAYAAGDFDTARQLWQAEAETGSPEGMMGLGLLADRGLGGPRDADLAYQWYLKAARAGLGEAQFNVAVLHDSGVTGPRDPQTALLWYTRAALRGVGRAQFNLGLIFAAGDGVARNDALAAHWFAEAAKTVPAASERVQGLSGPVPAGPASPPRVLSSTLKDGELELVWTASPGGARDSFLVEVTQAPGTDGFAAPLMTYETGGSGALLTVPAASGPLLWRVSRLRGDGPGYAAGPWLGAPGATAPAGRIVILTPDTVTARGAAEVFAGDLRASGYWVRLDTHDGPTSVAAVQERSSVEYRFAEDLALAERVAVYLPGLDASDTKRTEFDGTLPGEIFVRLVAAE